MTESESKDTSKPTLYITRRDFIRLAALAVAGASLAACQPETQEILRERQRQAAGPTTDARLYPEIPFSAPTPPTTVLAVLDTHEAATVDAFTARLYPGDASDPGAHELHVTNFIDKELAFHDGYVTYTYLSPPHMKTYEGDTHPNQTEDEGGPIVWVKKSEAERYGYQTLKKPVDRYRDGIKALDEYSRQQANANFADLKPDQQDQIIGDLEKDKPKNFKDPTAKQFFTMLQDDTIQGLFSDPGYGGNTNMIGWKQIGYPGAQRAYTPEDMNTEGPVRPPQSLSELHPFHPGANSNPGAIVPPSGSTEGNPNP